MLALRRGIAGWETRRNAAVCTIDWSFTTADARIKLKHLYAVAYDADTPQSAHAA